MSDLIGYIKRYRIYILLFFILFFVYSFKSIFLPVLMAFFLAYLINPLVSLLNKFKINRTLSISVMIVLTFVFISVFMLILIPELINQIKKMTESIPAISHQLSILLKDLFNYFGVEFEVSKYTESFLHSIKEYLPELLTTIGKVLLETFTKTKGLLGFVLNLIMIPLFLFYFLRDFKLIIEKIKSFIPNNKKNNFEKKLKEIDEIFKAYFIGQLTVVLFYTIVYLIGLSITGIDLAFVISIIGGLLAIIPYFGAVMGLLIALSMAVLNIPQLGIWGVFGVLITFGVSHLVDIIIITPKIMSSKIGLSPIMVILSLFVGGGIFGIFGMLFAIPVVAVLKIYINEFEENYKNSNYYKS